MIVADTNLLVYLLVPSPFTEQAERVRAREKIWVAPPLIRRELLSAFGQHMRRGHLTRDAALRAYRRGLTMVEVSVLVSDPIAVLRMVEQTGCSTYDAEYVWLAMDLGLDLITADRDVVRLFPDVAVDIAEFA